MMKRLNIGHIFNLGLIIVIGCLVYLILDYRNELQDLNDYLNENNFYPLILTAYNSHKNQTDDDPHITASGSKTSYQTLGLSRDFISRYNHPDCKGLNYGDTVTIVITKKIIVEDTMNPRYVDRGDAWSDSHKEARIFGIQKGLLIKRKDSRIKIQDKNIKRLKGN